MLSAFFFLLGMFDLPSGEWSGAVRGGDQLTLEVGPPETKIVTLRWHRNSKVRNEISVLGSYQVTATKGQPHVTMHVDLINVEGDASLNAQGGLDIGNWHILPDRDLRMVLRYEGKTLHLEAFDPDTSAHLEHFILAEQ